MKLKPRNIKSLTFIIEVKKLIRMYSYAVKRI